MSIEIIHHLSKLTNKTQRWYNIITLTKLKIKPDRIIVDGNYFKQYENIPYKCIIKGDEKFQNIAAASILAKTHRDELMNSLNRNFPKYSWNQNKGYATKKHRESIKKNGITKNIWFFNTLNILI